MYSSLHWCETDNLWSFASMLLCLLETLRNVLLLLLLLFFGHQSITVASPDLFGNVYYIIFVCVVGLGILSCRYGCLFPHLSASQK